MTPSGANARQGSLGHKNGFHSLDNISSEPPVCCAQLLEAQQSTGQHFLSSLVPLTRETASEQTVVQGIARFNKCPEERGGRGVAGMEMDSEAGVNLTRVVRAGCWKVTFKLRLEG